MADGIVPGARVEKTGGDYTFQGEIRSVFRKRSGALRVVVENPDGILHIFNPSQLQIIEEPSISPATRPVSS